MDASVDDLYFTWQDVEQWVAQGVITAEQAETIRQELLARPPLAPMADAMMEATTATPAARPVEQRPGLNLINIAYYFGAFMILFAYTIFMGLQWNSLGPLQQALVTVLTIGALWVIGYLLRRKGFDLAGGLLIFAGTGIFPLAIYTLLRLAGLWPNQPGYGAVGYDDFYKVINPLFVTMEVGSLLVALVVVGLIRFPLITLLIAFWGWYLSLDLVRWIAQERQFVYSDREQMLSLVIGLILLGVGVALQWQQARTGQDYSRWFYIFGHLIIITNFTALALDKEGLIGLLYLGLYIAFVVASVWLQRPTFLVFGALGCYGYISYLAFRVFDGALGFAFGLGLSGLIIVLTAVAYQRYGRSWLEARLGRYRVQATPQP